MKKERAIIIKDPRLRKVRNELRVLLKLWKSDINSELHKKIFENIKNPEIATKLNKKITELNLLERNSITTCPHCGFSNKDMVFVLHDGFSPIAQWICVECNSKREYFDGLRKDVLTEMTMMDIEEFLEKLSNGVGLSRSGWKCKGYEESERILFEMEISKGTQDKFLELCGYYDGYCDCEILLNAARHFLSQ